MKRAQKADRLYLEAIEEFAEQEDCCPIENVVRNPTVAAIATRFSRTPEEVARDINRIYLDSFKPVGSRLNLLD